MITTPTSRTNCCFFGDSLWCIFLDGNDIPRFKESKECRRIISSVENNFLVFLMQLISWNSFCVGYLPPGVEGLFSQGGLPVHRGVSICPGGVSVQGESLSGGSLSGRPPVRLCAGGTHPTGMHSCLGSLVT